jgi:hypothetical protein
LSSLLGGDCPVEPECDDQAERFDAFGRERDRIDALGRRP